MPKSELEQDDEEDCDKSDDESVKNVHENGNSEIQIDAEKEIETENNNSENTESVERKTGYDESTCSSESLRQTQKTRRILDSGTFYPSDNEDFNNSGNFNEYIGIGYRKLFTLSILLILSTLLLPFNKNKFRF
jgi:hypothetical protein